MIRFTLRQLEYFEALAETLHFGRAAALVGVTQPALSAQISELEERLGRRLLDRGPKSVSLTDYGVALRPRIERLLAEARALEEPVEADGPMRGRFRLGVIPTVAPYLLPTLLAELRLRHPHLSLELRETVTATLVDELLAGRLDAMIPALTVEPLMRDCFRLAVPASGPGFVDPPVAPESPVLERLMLLEEGHCMRDQALAICGAARPAALANFGATSLTTLLQMVAHGQGITLVPEMAILAGTLPPDIRTVPFAPPVPTRRIAMAWRRNGTRKADCLSLARIVRELMPASDGEQMVGEQEPHDRQHLEA
jgi:LysR family transcriptional regulator, hydrogen peroxide-inducible genes activator